MIADSPFLIQLDLNPDLSSSERRADFERVWGVNQHLSKILSGEIPLDDVLDVVHGAGVNPLLYADRVADAIEGVMNRGEILILE